MKRPVPLDAPRDFRVNEMFFSTTDRKGVILSGNDVFVRVSGYSQEELVGKAHNIIRHPDMPREVFRIVWEHLIRGSPLAGLIKNLAKDGRYYWVVAFLMPVQDGYLSIRFKPTSDLLAAVERLYGEMLTCERKHVDDGADQAAAMTASGELMLETLRPLGFATYDAFMRALLHRELKSRDAALQTSGLNLFPNALPRSPAGDGFADSVAAIYGSSRQAYAQINTLYVQLDEFALLNEKLGAKSRFVLELTKEFRLIAFNAALQSSRLGEEGRSLAIISEYLGTASVHTTGIVDGLTARSSGISLKLQAVVFNLAAARLQVEMIMSFCAELATDANDEAAHSAEAFVRGRRGMIEDLQVAFGETIDRAVTALFDLEKDLGGLGANSGELQKMVLTLQVAHVGGLVEASRVRDDDTFAVLFAELRQGVENTKRELVELDEICGRLGALAEETPAIAAIVSQAVAQMRDEVKALAAISNVATAAPAPGVAELSAV